MRWFTFTNVGAIVNSFHVSRLPLASLIGIDVDGSEKLADTVKGFELLPSWVY
jgi:hypothetical protein